MNKDDPPETGQPGSVGEARLFETSYRRSWPQVRLFPTPPRTFLRSSSCRLLLLKKALETYFTVLSSAFGPTQAPLDFLFFCHRLGNQRLSTIDPRPYTALLRPDLSCRSSSCASPS